MEEVTKRSRLVSITDVRGVVHFNFNKGYFASQESAASFRAALRRPDSWVSMEISEHATRIFPSRSVLYIDILEDDVNSDMLTLSGDVDE